MKPKKKLVFVQLPIPRLAITREDHNLPVAALVLQAYLQEQPIAKHVDIQLLDPDLQNYGSDETILREILKLAPDVVGLSLYCWNVERSLYLAEQIKRASSSAAGASGPLLVAGGPEVTPDNNLLGHTAIDVYVYGEGEYPVKLLLEASINQKEWAEKMFDNIPGTMFVQNSVWRVNPPQRQAVDLNQTTPAYLKNLVPRANWNEMFVETMRGCPFACRFCYYNKNCGGLRYLDCETVLQLVRYARDQQYRELFLLDPCFNLRPDLEMLLGHIALINADRQVKIATELRADMIDDHLAQLLADAGFSEVEVGLQSIHTETMQQIGRRHNLDQFLRGCHAMLVRGIATKVDLIVGLPGDTLEKFKQSARWVKREGLAEDLQVFCLSVLPGTFFRAHAEELGLRYSPLPPYYLLSAPDWPAEDITTAFSWAEDYFGMSFEPDLEEECTLQPVLDGRFQEILQLDPSHPCQLPGATTSITKWVIGPILKADDLFTHLPVMQHYTKNNPYSIYHVYIELQQEIPLDALFDFYPAFTLLKQQFIDRDLSVLSVDATAIFHYQIQILLKTSMLSRFSQQYLAALQQHFPVEMVGTNAEVKDEL
ncbi:radical SAM domain protein [Candidatus Vecturithrix granuli]|uniref:Radical SAM domain protein n=1 Tax=Vecturithrix granuli TaxID=1499967 RepID=A0A081BYS7_VECG1|nr:radical SAM domain protein [Candidatus Vecturithrix granuli]